MDTGRGVVGLDRDRESRGCLVGIELVVFATIFTLIVLLTGGPSNWI